MADNNEPTILDFETQSFKVFNSGVFKLSEEILNSYPQYERMRFELRNSVDETPYSGPIEPNFPENITTEFTINTSETTDVDNSPLLCLVNIDDNLIYWSCNCYGIVVPEEITIISPAEGQVISLNEQVPLIADVKPKGYDAEKYKVEWEVPEFDGSCKKTHDEQLFVLSDCDEAVIRAYISPLIPNGNRVETTNKVRFGCKIEKIELVDIKDRYFVGQTIASERNVKLTPVNAVAKDLSWSFDEQLIEITKDGELKAKASGTSIIQVSSGGIDSKAVTVHIPEVVVIVCGQTEIKANESIKLDCLFNSDAIPSSYKWECSNSDSAIFENPDKESTMLKAKSPDVVVITLTITDMAGTKYVSKHTINIIDVPVTDVVLTPNTKQELKKGDTMTFTANCLPADATDKSIEWSIFLHTVEIIKQDNTSIVVRGIKMGPSDVIANHGDIEARCDIIVREQPVVELPSTFDVEEGREASIQMTLSSGGNRELNFILQMMNASGEWLDCDTEKYSISKGKLLITIPKIEYKDNGTRYRCLASNSLYKDIASNVMALQVIAKAPIVSKITASPTYVKPGDSIDLSIDAKSSAKIEYVWEYRHNNSEWTIIGKDASLANPIFKVPANATKGAYSFRCLLRNAGTDDKYVTKNTANDVKLLAKPVFDSVSENRTVVEGDVASIKLMAKASALAGPAISYKWYDKNTNREVANGDTLTVSTKDVVPQGAASITFTYYCQADNGLTAQSKDVMVTVKAKPAIVTKQLSADAEYLIPESYVTLNITVQSKTNIEYKWYWKDKRGNETSFGVNKESVTYLVPKNATDDSYTFVCKVRNSGSNDAYDENNITLPLVPKPEVSVKASATSVREGDSITLTATSKNSGGPQIQYQWYIYEKNNAKLIPNANSNKVSLSVNDHVQWSKGAKQTLKFYCETSNGRKYKSADIEVVVRAQAPTVGNITADKTYLKPGDTVSLSINSSSKAERVYTWAYSLNSGSSNTLIGNSNVIFAVPNVSSGTYRFTCRIKNVGSDENPVERTLDMPVLEAPKFSNITQSQTLRDNSKVTLTAQAISNVSVPIKYTWYTYDINGKSKIVQNASSSSAYTFDTSTRVDCNNKIYQFKFWCVADNGIQTTSSTITVSIVPPAPTKPATTEPCKPRIIELGETITLSSGITAKLAAWKWVAYRYSTCSVNKEDGTTISNSEKLTNFKFTKEGIYCISCTAENPGGSPVTVWVGPVVVTYKKTKILLPSHYVLQKNDGGGIIYPRQDGIKASAILKRFYNTNSYGVNTAKGNSNNPYFKANNSWSEDDLLQCEVQASDGHGYYSDLMQMRVCINQLYWIPSNGKAQVSEINIKVGETIYFTPHTDNTDNTGTCLKNLENKVYFHSGYSSEGLKSTTPRIMDVNHCNGTPYGFSIKGLVAGQQGIVCFTGYTKDRKYGSTISITVKITK